MPLFRALAKNMAPMTNADESPTNAFSYLPVSLYSIYSLTRLMIWRCKKSKDNVLISRGTLIIHIVPLKSP